MGRTRRKALQELLTEGLPPAQTASLLRMLPKGWLAEKLPPKDDPRGALRPPARDLTETADLRKRLKEEIVRLGRDVSELALIAVKIRGDRKDIRSLSQARMGALHAALHATLDRAMESCDRLGSLGSGRYVLVLPGMGLLKARALAERVQSAFRADAQALTGLKISCALSIVCNGRDCPATSSELLERVRKGLAHADRDALFHIFQEASTAVSTRTTLVHPDEKRFLFSSIQ
ncbi:MAG: hypothetical protein LBR22_05990 [Desulfovibrio sp.]|nr:hypothetical protein [Desulfovibrio sp.]